MRIHRTTMKGARYASSFDKPPSPETLDALDKVAEAAVAFLGGGTRCSCCSDPTPAEDDAFYTAPWCGVCGHPGEAHARPPEAGAVLEERK